MYIHRCIIELDARHHASKKGNKKMEQKTQLKNVKKGDFFKRLTKGQPQKRVYVKDYYDRALKAFWCYPYDDINDGRFIKATTLVNVDFTF